MGTEIVPVEQQSSLVEDHPMDAKGREVVLMEGDLAKMTPGQRLAYYYKVCEDIGVNPLTRPFEYLKLNGKLVLYARKDCTEQLRANRKISLKVLEREHDTLGGVYTVRVEARLPDGRSDEACGSVATRIAKIVEEYDKVGNPKKKYVKDDQGNQVYHDLVGDEKANAIMKAETKAKRRATLSICGLGFLDESEVETIPKKAVQNQAPIRADQSEKVLTLVDNNVKILQANLKPYGAATLGRLNVDQADDLIHFLESVKGD